ncbi:uncharacterized protein BJ212DRAFT_215238 [Suillus subaureus]|uniref:Secreted protein n=1 Tax=Suillus subaureus TaxID=48587 RepID=A0A9P7DM91_9AGAM|nr:uncharacterized protein BJ212DRAFT_215238 [Suillus subaureus]KAG1798391.1 hypothetical protein BJ212DRAFT_215238 [Suillus subaureus]
MNPQVYSTPSKLRPVLLVLTLILTTREHDAACRRVPAFGVIRPDDIRTCMMHDGLNLVLCRSLCQDTTIDITLVRTLPFLLHMQSLFTTCLIHVPL